ncbi:uncharacterized protein LOC129253314 [Anastrepha obliqua]|uniref:uncharacterized protein LOC129253314 n=1 Tax=Anastrepha obliqua TaxID=95512 RepID=UPI00240908C0|nr:uncharacterized protein LOC129253314 [Anastrepha obliqua]
MKQVLIFATGVLLLVQTGALPIHSTNSNNDSHDAASEEGNPPLPQFVSETVSVIFKWVIDKRIEALENIVKELKEIPEKDELLQNYITRLSSVANEASELDQGKGRAGIMNQRNCVRAMKLVTEQYDGIPNGWKLETTVKKILKNNHFNKFEYEFLEKLFEETKNFMQAFGEYVNRMTPAERSNNSELVEWYDKIKDETDDLKRLKKFEKFLDQFNLE